MSHLWTPDLHELEIRADAFKRRERRLRWVDRACWFVIGSAVMVIAQALIRAALHFDRWSWMVKR